MTTRFNPLPSQEGGETNPSGVNDPQLTRFNPLPSQEGGETCWAGDHDEG